VKLVILAAVATSVLAAVMVTKLMATNVDEPEGAVSLSEIPGVWRSEGYNDVVEITDDGVVQYHISGSHCVRIDPKSSASRIDVAAQPHVLINDDRSRFATDPTVNSETWHSYYFSRLDALPDLCADGGTATTSDPLALFDAAWHSIEENYAFFDVRNANASGRFSPRRGPSARPGICSRTC